MLISRIGEFGLIERIKKSIKTDSSVIVGSGDDCAVLEYNKTHYQLFTCDMLVEGVDFTRETDPYLIGRKALAVSLSDIAACGGVAHHAVVSLGLPKNTSVEKIDKIIKGINDLAKIYKINIVGGDISRCAQLVVDVSMLGVVEKKFLVRRSTAQRGDIIMVSGELGGSIKGKHLRFTPRLEEARFLVKNFKLNAMIDISDGLTQDLGHILEASNQGAVIFESLIPVSEFARGLEDALTSGEDFELLFTMPRAQAKKLLYGGYENFLAIGEIVEKKSGFKLIKDSGREIKITPKGFRHF
jgi:thiamine-monophosphate kinase